MNAARRPVVVGTYLVWKRGPMLVRLILLTGAALATARILPTQASASSGAALFLTLVVLPALVLVGAWLALRRARTPTRVTVCFDGLALEPVDGGERRSWRWEELRLSLHADDEDGTLAVRGPFTGALLIGKDHHSSMRVLVEAIHGAGGSVSEVS